MTLHLVASSPFQTSALEDCLEIIQVSDTLVLIGDGVYGVVSPLLSSIPFTVYYMAEDALQRGITAGSCCQAANYAQLVDLAAEHPTSHTWR